MCRELGVVSEGQRWVEIQFLPSETIYIKETLFSLPRQPCQELWYWLKQAAVESREFFRKETKEREMGILGRGNSMTRISEGTTIWGIWGEGRALWAVGRVILDKVSAKPVWNQNTEDQWCFRMGSGLPHLAKESLMCPEDEKWCCLQLDDILLPFTGAAVWPVAQLCRWYLSLKPQDSRSFLFVLFLFRPGTAAS